MTKGACWSSAVEADCWNGPQSRLAAGFEDLDDDHTPAAARTSVPLFVGLSTFSAIGLFRRRGWVGCAEEPSGQCDIGGPVGIGEKAVMTDAVKSARQHMDQKATDELVGVERHKLVASGALGAVILPFESHALAVKGEEPA